MPVVIHPDTSYRPIMLVRTLMVSSSAARVSRRICGSLRGGMTVGQSHGAFQEDLLQIRKSCTKEAEYLISLSATCEDRKELYVMCM